LIQNIENLVDDLLIRETENIIAAHKASKPEVSLFKAALAQDKTNNRRNAYVVDDDVNEEDW
jgi:hypothetical protein